jgi:hypothetical protein
MIRREERTSCSAGEEMKDALVLAGKQEQACERPHIQLFYRARRLGAGVPHPTAPKDSLPT